MGENQWLDKFRAFYIAFKGPLAIDFSDVWIEFSDAHPECPLPYEDFESYVEARGLDALRSSHLAQVQGVKERLLVEARNEVLKDVTQAIHTTLATVIAGNRDLIQKLMLNIDVDELDNDQKLKYLDMAQKHMLATSKLVENLSGAPPPPTGGTGEKKDNRKVPKGTGRPESLPEVAASINKALTYIDDVEPLTELIIEAKTNIGGKPVGKAYKGASEKLQQMKPPTKRVSNDKDQKKPRKKSTLFENLKAQK